MPTPEHYAALLALGRGIGAERGTLPLSDAQLADMALDDRLRAAGMLAVADVLKGQPLDAFTRHAGVNDLASFGQWLELRRAESLRLLARFDLGDLKKDDELYEWAVAHAAVFSEAHVNFRAALEGQA